MYFPVLRQEKYFHASFLYEVTGVMEIVMMATYYMCYDLVTLLCISYCTWTILTSIIIYKNE